MRSAPVLLLLLAASLTAAEVSGKWTGTMTPPNGRAVPVYLTLYEQGQEISGSIGLGAETGQVAIADVQLHGDRLSFHAPDLRNHAVAFQLMVTVRSMSGEATSEGQTLKVSLSLQLNPPPATQSGVYHVGGGVSAPALIHKVDPEYSEEARKSKLEGTVLLKVEITPEGKATNIKVLHALGMGLDEKAVECVTKWRFKPGMKDGEPVTLDAQIEVNFRLLEKPTR
jgi:TonB family protein